ncbi:MAG: 4-alpha-glucanotransferase [Ardenticatenales bacterium]|nr:4-alpha-glucanotransferase [Ardenticatenales bacterium]
MKLPRSSGILLHPTSLPGRYGIGDLGESAYRFVDFLVECGQRWWQIMPLGPTGYGDSPYQSFSAFAGNPMLLSLEWMVSDGLLPADALDDAPAFSQDRVDYGEVQRWKMALLGDVFAHFAERASDAEKGQFWHFIDTNRGWLNDFALFMALKEHFNASWNEWPEDIRRRDTNALQHWYQQLEPEVGRHRLLQFLFWRQWQELKRYANERQVGIIGDIPIFVAYDSADVWAFPDLFHLDEQGNPTVVAGVPPDYFSATGQRWGNPLYRWDRLAERGFDWWVGRLATAFASVDVVRLDHFRAFEAYWEIPASEPTAENGRWVKAQGADLFRAVRHHLGERPIIAENLGVITKEVEALRKEFEFPGMRVLQFAFDEDPKNIHLPHNYRVNTVVYTGTHDNDTTLGWWNTQSEAAQYEVLRYLGRHHLPPLRIVPQLVRQAMRSIAAVSIFPMQDILNLGSDARMNTPGAAGGNWAWRFQHQQLTGHLSRWLYEMTKLYGRLPTQKVDPTS